MWVWSEVCGGGQLVLAGELFGVVGDAVQQQFAVVDDPKPVDLHLLGGFALNVGDAFVGACGRACAELHHGADGAEWVGFLANRGAELHHCLVVVAGVSVVEHRIGGRGEGFDRLAVVFEGACVVGQAGEDTHHIAVDHGGGKVLCDRADRCRGVGADAGQRLPLFGDGWFGVERDVFFGEFV